MRGVHAQHRGSLPGAVLRACGHGAMQLHCQVLSACTALWLSRAVLCACWHGAMHLHCQVCMLGVHAQHYGSLKRRCVPACLLARCNAVALPSLACFECMHSTMALSSRAVCLLARCSAFALPSFACMESCTALWLPGAVLRACWHGAMQLHCQVLHAWSACTALWLPGAVLSASRARCNALHCHVLQAESACTASWLS